VRCGSTILGPTPAQGVQALSGLGAFTQACVRATVVDAARWGCRVHVVVVDAAASRTTSKERIASWAMRRAGASLVPSLRAAGLAAASGA
jgi:nicotinamidase-related amidase